jgi:hypothetical protein
VGTVAAEGTMAAETTEPGHRLDLTEMVGHYLSVKVTYVHPDGPDEHVEFVGEVLSVDPLVSVRQPGVAAPFTLPPDPKSYHRVARSAFAPASLAETLLSPSFETTWRVQGPDQARPPRAGAFRPRSR